MKNLELLQQAARISTNNDVITLIKQFLLTNEPQATKFNPYDYTGKNRACMTGIFHSEGYKAATDGYIAISYKSDYAPELEGKIIDKTGSPVNDVFPMYRNVIPEDKNLTYQDIDFLKVLELEREYKADKKLNKELFGLVCISDVYFNVTLLAKIARFALNFGIKTIGTQDLNRCAKITDGTNTAIIMPKLNTGADAVKIYNL